MFDVRPNYPRKTFVAALLAFLLVPRHARGAEITRDGSSAAPAGTEEFVDTTTLRLPGTDQRRTTSRLTLPPGARWESSIPTGSLLLTAEQGALRIVLVDSWARIVRVYDPLLQRAVMPEMGPGAEAALSPGDRLVARGAGAIVARNAGETAAVASVVRISMR